MDRLKCCKSSKKMNSCFDGLLRTVIITITLVFSSIRLKAMRRVQYPGLECAMSAFPHKNILSLTHTHTYKHSHTHTYTHIHIHTHSFINTGNGDHTFAKSFWHTRVSVGGVRIVIIANLMNEDVSINCNYL